MHLIIELKCEIYTVRTKNTPENRCDHYFVRFPEGLWISSMKQDVL